MMVVSKQPDLFIGDAFVDVIFSIFLSSPHKCI